MATDEHKTITVADILDLITSRAARPLPQAYQHVSLEQLGFDSLGAIELQLDVEVLLGQTLGPDDIAGREGLSLTVGTLIERVMAHLEP